MRKIDSLRTHLKALRVIAAAGVMGILSIVGGSVAKGEVPGWLAELPSAAKVQAVFPASTHETYAKQSAVFAVLVDVIEIRSGLDPTLQGVDLRGRLTPEARQRWTDYAPHGYSKTLTSGNGTWQMFVNPGFREDVLSRFLPKTSIAAYEDARNHVSGVPGASNVKANWKPVEAPVTAAPASSPHAFMPNWEVWRDRLFGSANSPWRNVISVAAMVGVAIFLLERWVRSLSKSRLPFPPKERMLSKVTAVYWIAAVLFDLSTAFVIFTNSHNENTIIYGNSALIAVAVLGLTIGTGVLLDRHRKAFLRGVLKRYAVFRASAGSVEHQAYVLGTAIAFDPAKMTVSLLDDENSKTYDFADVRGWECRFEQPGYAYGTSSADVRAINQRMAADAQDRSGLFFTVKDVAHPVWHIRVYEKAALDRWREILTQALERQQSR